MERVRRYALLLCSVVMASMVFSDAVARRSDSNAPVEAGAQLVRLDAVADSFALALVANADLYNLPRGIRRVVVLVEGDSNSSESQLDEQGDTLILVPQFSVADGRKRPVDLPVWHSEQAWVEGEVSSAGHVGLSAFTVLDALVSYLGRSSHFPQLQEVVFVGRGTTADLVARHRLRPQVATSFRIRHVNTRVARY